MVTFAIGFTATNCAVDGDTIIVSDVGTGRDDGRLWRVKLNPEALL